MPKEHATIAASTSDVAPPDVFKLHATVAQVFATRCATAWTSYLDAAQAATRPLSEASAAPDAFWADVTGYWLDYAQRSILFWDTLRQRGNNWLEHEKAGKPPLLHFQWEMVADARQFAQPVNYALVRILPPAGVETDPQRRPFVVIDPRAGHGPGIGGFKEDSQVGVALKAGHPVYFLIFFPEPMPGQTLADVSRAEADFLQIVAKRHPDTRKPVIIGNCQGGWASMLVGALEPDAVGPIVINGAPMSYWAGNDGENPMRYSGGLLGGSWPALFASDLGAGTFDGAELVQNFEALNPANTYFDKYYTLFSKIDTEPQRFLDFERWWGGFFMMDRREIKWIVENLFVGNDLVGGEAEWSEGRAFDLRAIRSPIVLFASLGDNITPPQQAFNWVADLYPTTEALKANGQVIIGLMHKSVGHLGIFVSGQVARREHKQIFDLVEYIEHLPPGLYGMQIEEKVVDGAIHYDALLTERAVEDLHQLQKYARRDEIPFEAVKATSDVLASAYEAYAHPLIAALVTPAGAAMRRSLHPQRMQRWALSDLNPFLLPVKGMADWVKANRLPHDEAGGLARLERTCAALTSATWDLYRDLRDAALENAFFTAYGAAGLFMPSQRRTHPEPDDVRDDKPLEEVLSRIAEGGRTAAMVRTALLLMKAGTGRRRLSAMKRARELAGRDLGLLDMSAEQARAIIREQASIVERAPERALAALPALLPASSDRRALLDLLARLEMRLDANPDQKDLLAKLRGLLSDTHAGDSSPRRRSLERPSKRRVQNGADGTPTIPEVASGT
ncbi:DUF3141 domain-containing protein [Chelatococcus asaccharovorans]|uniref:DUF3141 domain-containing protein n=1 Tax=Chelatococcus asaccharovorans TaxID=28210 RepID=UPI00224C6635|nr:DUF3141 domain-containing protein [Chelatococcus asaccharovorans]CAH1669979.1 conserved hypothetical protein [Chelatococcus asaccharovorans]CAH1678595.1 conserved hypothetical protein [Chelatococcus asaccharovorans]